MTRWDATRSTGATVAILGDSMVFQDKITGPLRTALRATYGTGAEAWLSASQGSLGTATSTVGTAGTWTVNDQTASSTGLDVADTTSTDTATPASKTWVTPVGTDFAIAYLQKPDGGSFRYQVDGGAWTTVATAAGANTFATATTGLTGLANQEHTVKVEVTVAGAAGVTLHGLIAKTSTGVNVASVGNGSSATADWTDVDATIWQDALAALAPDVVAILLGPNDRGAEVTPTVFSANVSTLIGRIRAAVPTADVLLIAPVDQGTSKNAAMWAYVSALYERALADDAAFVNTYRALGDYDAANAAGYYADTTHVSASGGELVGEMIADYLQ